jgi:hypothetical protein
MTVTERKNDMACQPIASINADNHLPLGGNLIASCAYKDDVGRSRIRRLAPVEIG